MIQSEYRDKQEQQIAAVLARAGVDRSEVSAVIGGGEAGDRRLGFDATSKAAGQLAAAGFTGYEAGQGQPMTDAPNTKARSQVIAAEARRIVADFGIEALDAVEPNEARRRQLSVFAAQLQAITGCSHEAARQHVAKAARRLRAPDSVILDD